MQTEAEVGGTRPPARGRPGSPDSERGRQDPPLEPLEGAWPRDT